MYPVNMRRFSLSAPDEYEEVVNNQFTLLTNLDASVTFNL